MSWRDTLERALWTGVQAPAVVAVIDAVDDGMLEFDGRLLLAAGLGFLLSAVKSIAKDRLAALNRRRGRHVAR